MMMNQSFMIEAIPSQLVPYRSTQSNLCVPGVWTSLWSPEFITLIDRHECIINRRLIRQARFISFRLMLSI